LADRLEFYLREAKGQAYDVVKAVLAAGANDVRDAVARAEALTTVRGSADFEAVSASFKRMKNILSQAKEKGELPQGEEGHGGTIHPAQLDLVTKEEEIADRVKKMAERREYKGALEAIATLRPSVDAFFDQVMVMDPDPKVRAGRLWLLTKIVSNFSGIADFSEIVVAG
jgi:glycyl-tRNA synthetase beta chain